MSAPFERTDSLLLEDFGVLIHGPVKSFEARLSMEVRPGEIVALSGPMGSGKSLLVRALARLVPNTVRVVGSARLGSLVLPPVAIATQDPRYSVLPTDTVGGLLRERPAELHFPELFLAAHELRHRRFRDLSGSERVRVLIALALSGDEPVVIYDGYGECLAPIEERRTLEALGRVAAHGRRVLVTTRLRPLELPRGLRAVELAGAVKSSTALPLLRRPSDAPPGMPVPGATSPKTPPALELKNLSVALGGRAEEGRLAAHSVSLTLERGRSLALLGRSGSGKTLLLESIVGLRSQRLGRIALGGVSLSPRAEARTQRQRESLQLVFEDPAMALSRHRTIRTHFEQLIRASKPTSDDPESWLERLRLSSRILDLTPEELSAGELARVGLARSLALSPDVLLVDSPRRLNPFGDDAAVVAVLEAERSRGMAYLIATSDPATAQLLAEDVALLHAGRIIETGPVEEVLASPWHPLAPQLLHGPRPPSAERTLAELGCPLVEHCPSRQLPRCRDERPRLSVLRGAASPRRVACHFPLGWLAPAAPSLPAANELNNQPNHEAPASVFDAGGEAAGRDRNGGDLPPG